MSLSMRPLGTHARRAPSHIRLFRSLRSTRLRALLSLGIVLGFGATSTMAYWTDQATATGGTFRAGRLDLQLNNEVDDAYAFTALAMPDMIPGSSVAAMLDVQNKSLGAKLTYTMTGSATTTLGVALKLRIYRGGAATNSAGVGTCTVTTDPVIAETALTNTAGTAIISTPQGPLNAGTGVDDLCFRVELPTDANTNLQGVSSVAKFVFTATSVAP